MTLAAVRPWLRPAPTGALLLWLPNILPLPLRRLLQQPDTALRQLPHRCLQRLLAFARRPGQGRDDIVRRSAGLPFAVAAIFYSEPDKSQKVLLQRGMQELLHTAGDVAAESWPR